MLIVCYSITLMIKPLFLRLIITVIIGCMVYGLILLKKKDELLMDYIIIPIKKKLHIGK